MKQCPGSIFGCEPIPLCKSLNLHLNLHAASRLQRRGGRGGRGYLAYLLPKSVVSNSSSTEAFLGAAAFLSPADGFPLDLSAILSSKFHRGRFTRSPFPPHPPRPHTLPLQSGAWAVRVPTPHEWKEQAAVGAATFKHTSTVVSSTGQPLALRIKCAALHSRSLDSHHECATVTFTHIYGTE